MPEAKVIYINPADILGSIEPTPQPTPPVVSFEPSLEPSGPHQLDLEVEEAQEQVEPPQVSLNPGIPPVGAPHYTSVLDDLWPEFDDPEERTAARLLSLLEEVKDEAQRVHLLSQDVWDKLPEYKVPASEHERFQKEFLAYLKRIRAYRDELEELDPDSTATDDVYVGLVKRREGAGPVPDAIMHMYFAQQLGILQDHADEMGEGFMGRVMEGLERADRIASEAADVVEEASRDSAEQAGEVLADVWDRAARPLLIGVGVLAAAVITGAVGIIYALGSDDE